MSKKVFGLFQRKTLDKPELARRRIEKDVFLRNHYLHATLQVRSLLSASPNSQILEVGAAGGVTKMFWPEVHTSDIRQDSEVDFVMAAEEIKFESNYLDGIFGIDALHHIDDPVEHFREVSRVLKNGASAVYIDPNWNLFSKIIFRHVLKYIHPEPYDTDQLGWIKESNDPTEGNQAMAYIIFVRDFDKFRDLFPNLHVEILQPVKGLSFLFSGGVHTRTPIPGRLLWAFQKWENNHNGWMNHFGLARLIRITKYPKALP